MRSLKNLTNPLPPNSKTTKQDVQSNYDKMSWYYGFFASFERRCRRAGINLLQLKAGERLLEIGFGTGNALSFLSKKVGPTGELFGVDLSLKMTKRANRKVQRLKTRVNLLCGDATFLPFVNCSFDAIFISFTLELLSEQEITRALKECSRTLVEGGYLCVLSLSRRTLNCLVRLYERLHAAWPLVFDCRPILIKEFLDNSFSITREKPLMLWGLPVDIIVAEKKKQQ